MSEILMSIMYVNDLQSQSQINICNEHITEKRGALSCLKFKSNSPHGNYSNSIYDIASDGFQSIFLAVCVQLVCFRASLALHICKCSILITTTVMKGFETQ